MIHTQNNHRMFTPIAMDSSWFIPILRNFDSDPGASSSSARCLPAAGPSHQTPSPTCQRGAWRVGGQNISVSSGNLWILCERLWNIVTYEIAVNSLKYGVQTISNPKISDHVHVWLLLWGLFSRSGILIRASLDSALLSCWFVSLTANKEPQTPKNALPKSFAGCRSSKSLIF